MSKALATVIELIICFLSFNLLMWCITLIDLWILKNPCIPSLSSFTFIMRLFSSSSLSAIRVVFSAYLRLLIYLLALLIPTCACFLQPAISHDVLWHKQSDSIQPWHTLFPIWNQCVGPCLGLIVASWPAYTFLRRLIRWSGIPISFRIFHSLLWSTQSRL